MTPNLRRGALAAARVCVARFETLVAPERRVEIRLGPLPDCIRAIADIAAKHDAKAGDQLRVVATLVRDAGLTWADLDSPSGTTEVQA